MVLSSGFWQFILNVFSEFPELIRHSDYYEFSEARRLGYSFCLYAAIVSHSHIQSTMLADKQSDTKPDKQTARRRKGGRTIDANPSDLVPR